MAKLTAEDGAGSRPQMRTVSIRLSEELIALAQEIAEEDGTRYTILLRTLLNRAMREVAAQRKQQRRNGAA